MNLKANRADLDGEKQKRLLTKLLSDLSATDSDLYYKSTNEIAVEIRNYIDDGAKLMAEDKALLDRLSQRDIEVLLSLH